MKTSRIFLILVLIAAALAGGLCRRLHAACRDGVRAAVFNGWLLVVFVLSEAFLAGATYNPFIYFRF